ncbi:MAG: hypothetical protein M3Y48_09975 [Actinomycetota bacterium]|nr:hypothetical protein [Actinomycetota bacterium]
MSRQVVCLAALLALAGCGAAPATVVAPMTTSAHLAHGPTLLVAEPCRVVDARADVRCTPGVLNPDVTQDNIHATICAPGWTDTVRPPASYTAALKLQQMRDFGEPGSPLNYKEDHLVPLSIGGAPSDPHNLFPQPTAKTTEQEDLEDHLHTAVCSGQMALTAAQETMRHNWTH